MRCNKPHFHAPHPPTPVMAIFRLLTHANCQTGWDKRHSDGTPHSPLARTPPGDDRPRDDRMIDFNNADNPQLVHQARRELYSSGMAKFAPLSGPSRAKRRSPFGARPAPESSPSSSSASGMRTCFTSSIPRCATELSKDDEVTV
jgi:hypothetical protein